MSNKKCSDCFHFCVCSIPSTSTYYPNMCEYFSEAVGEGHLQEWYIHSVSSDDEPKWTEKHIEELAKDFILIPRRQ